MISKCANPACAAQFRYLHEGRVFNIEIPVPSARPADLSCHRIEHFWLCEGCVKVLKVVLDNGVVITRPLHPEVPEAPPDDERENEPQLPVWSFIGKAVAVP
jgi:hypothetical protein